jgi:type II secretory pathway predicted ATPase ExeA
VYFNDGGHLILYFRGSFRNYSSRFAAGKHSGEVKAMYREFYQMKKDAFGIQPLPEVFFHSKTHKDAWYYLLYGMSSEEYFLLVTGDYGLGKTTLCLKIVQTLKKKGEIPFTYISTPNYSFSRILQEVAGNLGLAVPEEDNEIQYNIYHYLEDNNSRKRFFLIIDDSQYLDMSILAKLQLFANFNYNGFFPIRIIFFAHTSFLEILKSPELEALGQRIKRKCHLHPLALDETKEYIYFRLLKSGAPGVPAFTEDAVRGVFDFSKGVPRLINNLCDTCLLLGAKQKVTTIDTPIVTHALEYVEGRFGKSDNEVPLPSSTADPVGSLLNFEDVAKPESPFLTGPEANQILTAGARPVEGNGGGPAFAWKIVILAIVLLTAGILIGLLIDLKPLANKYLGLLFNASR